MSMYDVIFLFVFAVVIGIVAIVSLTILTAINSDASWQETMNQSALTDEPMEDAGTAIKTLDYGLTFFIIMTGLITIGLATLVGVNPVFYIGSLIIQIVIVAVSAIISNVFLDVVSNDQLSAAAAEFPITLQVIGIYPLACLVISVLVAIVTYSKTQSVGTYG